MDVDEGSSRRRAGSRAYAGADCLDDANVARLLDPACPPAAMTRGIEHAAVCEPCRELMAAVGRVRAASIVARGGAAEDGGASVGDDHDGPALLPSGDDESIRAPLVAGDTEALAHLRTAVTDASRDPDAEPGSGRTLGRYVVLEVVGQGAMGQVLRAYDPKLRREVALKIVRTRGRADATAAEARLLREAYALARLSHPNVVAIYDAETTDRGVAIAMEYVEGHTLRAWLAERQRAWTEVVDVGMRIAAGLAAAHAAGLVHRDVKPDNVLVGKDGRVRVSDFGLARALDGASVDARGIEFDVREGDATLTGTGQIVGTPAYMAPEQHDGAVPDARADQYALCVVLYEALYGERPFQARSLALLAMRKRAGPPQHPPMSLPGWLHAAVLRGLSPDPDRRWPSVDALRRVLASGRRRGRQRRLMLAFGAVLAIVGAWAVSGELDRRASVAACREDGRRFVDGLGDDAARAELHAALVSADVAFTADRVVTLLDAYVQELQQARTRACLDTNIDGAMGWDAEVLDRATWCLDERRGDAAALRSELLRGDATALTYAVQAVASLAPVQPCRDLALLARLPAPSTSTQAEAHAVRRDLSRVRALARLGAYAEGLTAARAVHERAQRLDWPPLSSEARRWVGNLLEETGEYEAAASELEAAYFEAARAGANDVAADAAIRLVFDMGEQLARYDEALRWARHAEVAVAASADPAGLREAERLNNVALVHGRMGELATAEATAARALELVEATLGADHVTGAVALETLALAQAGLGKHHEANATLERALRIEEQTLGPEHPGVATTLNNLAAVLIDLGAYAEAKDALERALQIRRRALGEEHADVAMLLMNLGVAYVETGDYERGRDLLAEGVRIQERLLPPDHPELADGLGHLAHAHVNLKDYERARQLHERALQITTRTFGPDHVDTALPLAALGQLEYVTGNNAAAKARFERTLAILEAELGPEHPDTIAPRVYLAEIAVAEGRAHDATLLAERALALAELGETTPGMLAMARFVLARALVADGGATARALSLAERAREAFVAAGPAWSASATDVEVWLGERAVALGG